MIIRIDLQSETPIYLQLSNQIIENMANGNLKPGEEVPSIRSLAADLGINIHTVNKAYSLLKQKGLLTMHNSRGIVATRSHTEEDEKNMSSVKKALRPIIAESICYGFANIQLKKIVDELYKDIKGGKINE
ncbi:MULTISPECIES: GntR family transcriptional regulator [Anoxybacillaceae]|jgi:GntR family transcriptional regulator|uniref:GntR family transcriptional regulator n=1 Tax=Anoxybacteroides rupiense TaxID=311460 RepID=A0ABD5IY30_9BACL|nr:MULTISPECIES: GntR family transcriptional regulator [Anoxybacillus]MBB3909317.1 DNA-binding transcriptional regulator YhcF (GntR family) [Anoxybacillus rupiensis]MED5053234.1 GntR family transcriptional regulator [Anoxybacillus rupiensis]OQM47413.1 GntR family transcriptional regulator [Anoxybacillus sp. UARK-01]